jgi:hypothetical protein
MKAASTRNGPANRVVAPEMGLFAPLQCARAGPDPRALEGVCDDLAVTQREISVLGQTGRELAGLVGRFGGGADPFIRRHLDEITRRTALALARQASIAQMMEECGRERAKATSARPLPVRRFARPKSSIAGRTKSP